jgi:hypothetical protein
MWEILIWIYALNSLLLINHEIDSAYWKEWNLFGMKGGMNGFLVFNIIAVALLLYGMIEVVNKSFTGMIFSFLVAIIGFFTFGIHMFFLAKGRKEFKVPFSIAILVGILAVSITQLILSILLVI